MHPVIPVPIYVPVGPKFIGAPDPVTGAIQSDEIRQADAYINRWAYLTGNGKYATAFYHPPAGSGVVAASAYVQADQLDKFITGLSDDVLRAINLGTRSQRFLMSLMLEATNFAGTPQLNHGVSAPQAANWTVEGSLFAWRLACFQHNLNVGWYGQSGVSA